MSQLLLRSYLTLRHGYQVPLRSKSRDLKSRPIDELGKREHEFPRIINFTTWSLGKSRMPSQLYDVMVTSELEMGEEGYDLAVNWQLLLLILFSAFASKVLRTLSPGACQWVCS